MELKQPKFVDSHCEESYRCFSTWKQRDLKSTFCLRYDVVNGSLHQGAVWTGRDITSVMVNIYHVCSGLEFYSSNQYYDIPFTLHGCSFQLNFTILYLQFMASLWRVVFFF